MVDVEQDDPAIRELFDRQISAWARADHELFASAFTEDADFINITATPLRGQQEIARHHAQLWATLYKGSQLTQGPIRVRFIHPDVAVIESEATLNFGEHARHAHALAVAIRAGDGWKITALHNMLPFVPPQA